VIGWRILAPLALVCALIAGGYVKGHADAEARHTAAALAQAVANDAATRKLAAAEQSARLLSQALEDQAHADPVQSPSCLPRSRVLRLNTR